MKTRNDKRGFKALVAFFAVTLFLTGCGKKENTETQDSSAASTSVSSTVENTTRTFVDSAGREVELPTKITKVAPSGAVAQIPLYTACPDLMVGLANPIGDDAKEYIREDFQSLPTFGQFYGKNASLNMEALTAAAPEVIIDIGEAKDTIKEDMDGLQEQIDIPTVFIEANLEETAAMYNKLGELLGDTTQTDKLAKYADKVIDMAKKNKAAIGDADAKSVYYATGDAGLNTNAEGSFHAQVFDVIGAKNAATGIEVVSKGGGSVISMEQLMQWQPDYIIADSDNVYNLITTDSTWQELTAVKEGRVYRVPTAPYNFLGFPPSVNRLLGIQWLGNLMYPDVYDLDVKATVKDFYDLFYHVELSDTQLAKLLENATAK